MGRPSPWQNSHGPSAGGVDSRGLQGRNGTGGGHNNKNKATLENIVNPTILGGFILRVGDVQYDASISNYLNELRKEFDHSDFIPKI